jgi:hypothetical protein
VARLRLAPLYVLAVVIIGVVLDHAVGAQTRTEIVLANSTNVVNLQHHRIWTLVTSAFVVDEQVQAGPVIQLLLLMAVAELLWGWRRLLEVFFLTNAVASCLVYALLRVGLRHNWLNGAVMMASDVGTSYGAHAVSGAIAISLPARARRILVPLALLTVVVPLIGQRSFTDVGHLLSTLIGFLAGWQIRRRPLAGHLHRPALLRTDRSLAYAFDSIARGRRAPTAALHRHLATLDGVLAGGCWGVVLGTFIGRPLAGLVAGAAGVVVAAHLYGGSGWREGVTGPHTL